MTCPKRILLLLTVACLAGIVYADTYKLKRSGPLSPAQTAVKRGLQNLSKGDLRGAESAFRESIRLDPKLPDGYLGLADLATRRGDAPGAEKLLKQALTVDPKDIAVERAWGRYLMGAKRYAEAENAFRAAVATPGGQSALVYQDLGNLLLVQKRASEAATYFGKSVALEPENPEFHRALGTALSALGRTAEAEAELQKAVQLEPNNPKYGAALGLLYTDSRQYPKAIQTFDRLISNAPGEASLYMARGDAYSLSGDTPKGLSDYEAAIRLQPGSAGAQFKKGLALLDLGRNADAKAAFRETIRLDKNFAEAYNNLAFLSIGRKETLPQALEWANKAVALDPQNPGFRDTLAWVKRARGESAAAIEILEAALKNSPQRPDLLYHLAVLQEETGQKQAATATLQRSLNSGPFPEADDARRRLKALSR